MAQLKKPEAAPFLARLRELPFVENASFARDSDEAHLDGRLTIGAGRCFNLNVVERRSYLDGATVHALGTLAARSARPLIVFARYIPRPSGERLIAAGVNFVDEAGNVHLTLGKKYSHTILGQRQSGPAGHDVRLTAAQVQVLFARAADPALLNRPVREIARQAGVSKSKAAQIRQELAKYSSRLRSPQGTAAPVASDQLLSGYSGILRPKLFAGRFRAAETEADRVLEGFRNAPDGIRFSLTGAVGANQLQHFYRGPDIVLFIDAAGDAVRRAWRLMPDQNGPIALLRAFGELPFWRTVNGLTVAHPWLIYAELMHSEDPRAHEAAEELRSEYLAR